MLQKKFRLNLFLIILGLFLASNNTVFAMKTTGKKTDDHGHKHEHKKACNHHHHHDHDHAHEHKKPASETLITLVQGDITQQQFDDPEHSAIVNAANERLIGGAGVAAAIQNAGGQELMDTIRSVETRNVNGVEIRREVGGTVLTTSGNMSKRDDNTRVDWVIHAVGPDLTGKINRSVSREDQNDKKEAYLRCASRNVLNRAFDNKLKTVITTVAFVALSTNIFGYKSDDATPVMIDAVVDWLEEHEDADFREIRFVVRDKKTYDVYRDVLFGLVDDGRLKIGKAIRIENSDLPKARFTLVN